VGVAEANRQEEWLRRSTRQKPARGCRGAVVASTYSLQMFSVATREGIANNVMHAGQRRMVAHCPEGVRKVLVAVAQLETAVDEPKLPAAVGRLAGQ
jgi:hypothetical protein